MLYSMIARALIAAALVPVSIAAAQAGPPPTDIFLAPLTINGATISVGAPVNITSRAGYDNQPAFTPDGRGILYTSVRADAQADIYRYDIASKATTRVTSTPESEYSATPMPGGGRFSVIRVERDSTQRLWSFDWQGGDPRLVVESVKPVGYHTWVDSTTLALFVLGRPNALVVANTRSSRVDTLIRDIGRSLTTPPVKPPGRQFAFVKLAPDSTWNLMGGTRDAAGWLTERVMSLPRGAEFVAWPAADVVVTATGSKILVRTSLTAPWVVAADFASAGLKGITRLAVSPDGKWLAFAAEDR